MPIRSFSSGAKDVPKPVEAWSYSRLQTWKQCPAKYKYQYIDKIPRPAPDPEEGETPLERGIRIHKLAEDYLLAKIKPKKIPEELARFAKEFEELRKLKKFLTVEMQWAFSVDWESTSWFKSQNLPAPWLRAKLDACYDLGDKRVVIDFKTGRVRKEHEDQLSLYAVCAFSKAADHVNVVDSHLYYLDSGDIVSDTYTRRDFHDLKKKWKLEVKPMFEDEKFETKQSRLCDWCEYGKSSGGQCEFG